MPSKTITENEIQRLARIFREALQDISKNLFDATDLERARLFAVARQAFQQLSALDDEAELWARSNIRGLYRLIQREIDAEFHSLGIPTPSPRVETLFSTINMNAIRALLQDPQTGFLSSIWEATQEIRNRVKTIQQQVLALQNQSKIIEETLAKVGLLSGKNLNTVKEAILQDLLSSKASSNLLWRKAFSQLGPQNLLSNFSNLPYISFPTSRGTRYMRLDRYVELVARTKTSQVTDLARRNAYLKYGQHVVIFSRNRSKWKDACDLYIGRAFALTATAAKENDIAHVDQLPSGGIPLHPNCTHVIHVWFDGLLSPEMQKAAFTKPPSWALGKSWAAVQAEFKRRGGEAYAASQNPMFKYAQAGGGFQRRYGR